MKILFKKERSCPGIYAIENKINGKLYVGKAKCVYRRLTAHRSALRNKSKDENRHLINAYHKYGPGNFIGYFLEKLPLDDKLIAKQEHYWILKLGVLDRDVGYNLRLDSSTGLIVTQETRDRCSTSGKKRYRENPELAKNIANASRTFWKENPKVKEQMAEKVSKATSKFDILKMSFNLEVIEEFKSTYELHKQYPDYYLPAIRSACNGHKNSYKGFIWRYRNKITGEIKHRDIGTQFNRKIMKIDSTTGKVLVTWDNTRLAANDLKYSAAHVCKLAKTQEQRQNFNYYLKYECRQ